MNFGNNIRCVYGIEQPSTSNRKDSELLYPQSWTRGDTPICSKTRTEWFLQGRTSYERNTTIELRLFHAINHRLRLNYTNSPWRMNFTQLQNITSSFGRQNVSKCRYSMFKVSSGKTLPTWVEGMKVKKSFSRSGEQFFFT